MVSSVSRGLAAVASRYTWLDAVTAYLPPRPMRDLVLSARTDSKPAPILEEMQGVC